MDAFRRVAEGRLSEVFGKLTLNTDIGMRTVFTTRDGRRIEEALWEYVQAIDPELARLEEAYAAGVNAWLADLRAGRNEATLPPEYLLFPAIDETPDTLADWRPQDTAAIARLQAYSLSETLEEEIERARIMVSLPPEVVKDVFRSAPATAATVLPVTSAGQGSAAAVARVVPELPPVGVLTEISAALQDLRRSNPFGSKEEGAGSNNWIVSPGLSANGHAMLANDPHLQLFNPPIWHMIQLDAGAGSADPMRVNGVIFPGLPGVILGHNDFGAWGATVAEFDVTDVYLETVTTPPDYPNSPRTVLFKGQQVPVLRIEETIQVKYSDPVTTIIEVVPHHGPMVPDPNLRDNVVGLAATNMSFRWTGHELSNDARFLIDLDRARNVGEFRSALRNFAVGAQNWVWADVHGDIAYFPHVLIPQRPPGTVPYLPMSGTGDAEWLTDAQGHSLWLPDDRIPQATNPPQRPDRQHARQRSAERRGLFELQRRPRLPRATHPGIALEQRARAAGRGEAERRGLVGLSVRSFKPGGAALAAVLVCGVGGAPRSGDAGDGRCARPPARVVGGDTALQHRLRHRPARSAQRHHAAQYAGDRPGTYERRRHLDLRRLGNAARSGSVYRRLRRYRHWHSDWPRRDESAAAYPRRRRA
jgi:penicillin amidase